MKPVFFAAALLLAGSVLPASSQPYGGYGGGGYGGGGYGGGYGGGRDYGDEYDRPRYRRDRDFDDRSYGRPRGRLSTVCATSRGSCPTRPTPPNTPCGCEIPGFGYKRGATY